MLSKGKILKNKKPEVTNITLQDVTHTRTTRGKEPLIDLYMVFDETLQESTTNDEKGKPIDSPMTNLTGKEDNYYKVLFESAIDGIIIVDADTMRIMLANQKAADMYGFYEPEDMLGVNPLKLVHPEDKNEVLRIIIQDMIENNLRLVHRFRGIDKYGLSMWLRAVGSRTEYRGQTAALISIREVHDQPQDEIGNKEGEQRLEFASHLASVGDLATGLAHQLNDPLSAILAYDQLLITKTDLDQTTRHGLEAIYRETQRATMITDNLRHFANRRKPEKNPLSINEVVGRAIDICAHELDANTIEVYKNLKNDLPVIQADFQQICQVLINIINNAANALAATPGKKELYIVTQLTNSAVKVTITDNGRGIPEADVQRIFDPFFTNDRSGKKTGLGLTVCYGLIEGHGGRIYADSMVGRGTTITIELPVFSKDTCLDKTIGY